MRMGMEFRLRGIEKLPSTIRAIKNHLCAIIALQDSKIDIKEAIASIPVMYSLGKLSKGTGFLLSSGYVTTALHVVDEAYKIYGLTPSGKYVTLKLMKKNKAFDLALLEPEEVWSSGLHIPEDVRLQVGDLILTLGYPLNYMGDEPILTAGFLSNIIRRDITKLIVNCSFNVGNSGGPLLNADGRLVGIVIAKSILKDPYIEMIEKIMEHPGVELVYASIKLPGGFEEEITLSKAIRIMIKWMAANFQTNIGIAISSAHLRTLVEE